MRNINRYMIRRAALCGAVAVGLGASSAAIADRDDLITTASTAGTTAYIVGKNIDDNDFAQAREFSDSQSAALRREAATGEGENIDSLAALLGESDSDAFGQWMQAHYADLYGQDVDAKAEHNTAPSTSNLADRIVAMR